MVTANLIRSNPSVMMGKPVVAGTRIPVDLILLDGKVNWRLEDRIRQSLYPIEIETGAVLTVTCYSKEDWYSPSLAKGHSSAPPLATP